MATVYRIVCESSGQRTELEITDSVNPLPGSDTWRALDPEAWGFDKGPVASWSVTSAHLHGAGATAVAILEGFTKQTKVSDTGKGNKNDPDGTFPDGEFIWRCVQKK